MKHTKSLVLVILTALSFQSKSLDMTPSSCAQLLYQEGGLSKLSARDQCRQGIPEASIQCQSVLFLALGFSPQTALNNCRKQSDPRFVQCLYKSLMENNLSHDAAIEKCQTTTLNAYGYFEYGNSISIKTEVYQVINPKFPTVCSITLNSFNEREAFKSEFKNDNVNFVELLPERSLNHFIPRDKKWLMSACEKKIKCDTLVISGHFADRFLGDAGFEIPTQDLLDQSCTTECKDFFNSISKVFLFGCNTLATKDPDYRSFEVYRQTLIADGLSENEAEKVASQRYQVWGLSFRETMQGMFPSATVIDGFSSASPIGSVIEKPLTRFLKSFSSYKDFSENLVRRNLSEELTDLSMIQLTNLSSKWNKYVCGLIAKESSSKVYQIQEIMKNKQLKSYLYLLNSMSLKLSKQEILELNSSKQIRFLVDKYLADLYRDTQTMTSVKLIFLQTFYRLGFIDSTDYFALSRDLILGTFQGMDGSYVQKKICDYGDNFPVGSYIQIQDLHLPINSDSEKALNCLKAAQFSDNLR